MCVSIRIRIKYRKFQETREKARDILKTEMIEVTDKLTLNLNEWILYIKGNIFFMHKRNVVQKEFK